MLPHLLPFSENLACVFLFRNAIILFFHVPELVQFFQEVTLEIELRHDVVVGRLLLNVDSLSLDMTFRLRVGERRAYRRTCISLVLQNCATEGPFLGSKMTDGQTSVTRTSFNVILHEHGLVRDEARAESQPSWLLLL